MRSILYLNYGSLETMRQRNAWGDLTSGVLSDRGGAFERVTVVLFPAGRRARMRVSSKVELIEFDVAALRVPLPRAVKWAAKLAREVLYLAFVIKTALRTRAAIIEATEPYLLGLNALIAARLTGRPYSMLVTRNYDLDHAMIGADPARPFYRWRMLAKVFERLVFRNADVVVADRDFYAKYAIANGAHADRVIRGRVLADPAFYTEPASRQDMRGELGVERSEILLYVGRLSAEKHVLDLVDVLASVRVARPRSVLVLAGDGPLGGRMQVRAAELGVADAIKRVGPYSPEKLAALMTSADVILGPHMGYTLVEAALSLTPIVAYDWEWHSEVVRSGESGVLVPFGDHAAMADATLRILHDDELRSRLARTARSLALEQHSRESVMEAYRSAFDAFFAGRSTACRRH